MAADLCASGLARALALAAAACALASACDSDEAAEPPREAGSHPGGQDGGRARAGSGGSMQPLAAGSGSGGLASVDSGTGRSDAGRDGGGRDAGDRDAGSAGTAFEPNPALADLADNGARDLGRFECEQVAGEDEGECRKATDYSGMVYDSRHHRVLSFGGGHATTMTDAVHALDLAELAWSDLYPPTPCAQMTAANLDDDTGAWKSGPAGPFPRPVSTHTYDMLAVAPELDELVVISRVGSGGHCNPVGNDIGGKIAHFDLSAESWSFSATAEGSTYELSVDFPGSERDPKSGLIVLLSRQGLSVYDPRAREYTHVDQPLRDSAGDELDLSQIGYANQLVYFPPDDAFYLMVRGSPVKVYALHFDRQAFERSSVDRVDTTGPTSPHGEPGYDYDSVNDIIGGGVQDSTFYAFTPATRTWQALTIAGAPGTQAFHALAYDPVDNVFVFVTDYDSGQRTWTYRYKRAR